ncbi:histidyl-tRNA synthetase [Sporothrix schenckii 1099-18]|uniref:Histidine--tRNA ligase, mitochondrial n=1 Tax=Sporothrix schenckii 1099-18 TaxID=1397361 RepID=A0A0F2M4X2_SPOSC|nr:histidyl-tRNA synthetase [Sporothrix schenckii 1099-18]KJR83855.1 histidyl-tRNA synthetase [Sporothrix schenckii 1099-18]
MQLRLPIARNRRSIASSFARFTPSTSQTSLRQLRQTPPLQRLSSPAAGAVGTRLYSLCPPVDPRRHPLHPWPRRPLSATAASSTIRTENVLHSRKTKAQRRELVTTRAASEEFSDDVEHDLDSGMASKEGKDKAKGPAVQLKTPKGTRDWTGADMILRDEIFTTITDVFKRHGGVPLDTPVFELKEVLAGKYGEDSRLIYDLADQGGELTALRYDLTVPFARFLAMNKVQQIKRYQIAKVYRRDQPAVARGRMREFYQCDFDIAGTYDRMIPDAEILRVICEIFDALQEPIVIKLNHRQILDGLFAVSGVPADKIRTISSAVDKLDKLPWADVKKEMVDEKGLDAAVADRIGDYVKHSGDIPAIVALLKADAALCANSDIQQGLDDMELLNGFLEALGVPSTKVSFDMALCRGLDYYTGLIFEVTAQPSAAAVETDAAPAGGTKPPKKKGGEEIQVGSIAAGGRYDNLVGMYGKTQIPCVGISFGVDRIFTIMKAKREKAEGRSRVRETDVYVMAFGGGSFNGLLKERMQVARRLWDAGIKAEFAAKTKPRLPQQFKAAEDVPLGVILGEDELANGQVRLKVLGTGGAEADEKDRGQLVSEDDLVAEIKKLLI